MKRFNQLSLTQKLISGIGLILLFVTLGMGYNLWTLQNMTSQYEDMIRHDVMKMKAADDLSLGMTRQAYGVRGYILVQEDVRREQIERGAKEKKEALEQLLALSTTEAETKELESMLSYANSYDGLAQEVIVAADNQDQDNIDRLTLRLMPDVTASITETGERLQAETEATIIEKQQELEQLGGQAFLYSTGIALLTLLLTLGAGYMLQRMVTVPLLMLSDEVGIVADGDLTRVDLQVTHTR